MTLTIVVDIKATDTEESYAKARNLADSIVELIDTEPAAKLKSVEL